mgnify:CR=1 FL=1
MRSLGREGGFDETTFPKLPPWTGFKVNTGTDEEGESDGTELAIKGIALGGMRLRGVLPKSFVVMGKDGEEEPMVQPLTQQLFKMDTLSLGNNRLWGPLPRELLRCLAPTELRFLELNDNELVGRLPTEIGLFENLLELKLQYNKFSGIVPTEIGRLQQLQRLQLGRNSLSGPIPSEFGMLGNLRVAEFHNNRISAVLASEWQGKLRRSTELKLQGNQIRNTSEVKKEIKQALGPMCYVVL